MIVFVGLKLVKILWLSYAELRVAKESEIFFETALFQASNIMSNFLHCAVLKSKPTPGFPHRDCGLFL
ncbi:hypothetical protein D5R40_25390 [Okeania hirsuta]|uniref:Uncharacterized protein n=1 Tax=Okeania hirsuta TaxID=1458930 RepID=A0A3N6P5Z8_9CYAN|nr:hypothetical protein D5R40_25390 [Okeania hirsuta]